MKSVKRRIQGEPRRLAAVMFTDIVGFTALAQKNESLSLSLLREYRKLARSAIRKQAGREIKTIGDAILVEFPSALGAVRCACEMQQAIRERNLSVSEDKQLGVRVGVHLGDVVDDQGDIAGDAVNVASRIESLAEPLGVCITRHVYDHVRNKVDLKFQTLGPKKLKNVSESLEVFKMEMPWQEPEEIIDYPAFRVAVLPFANISPNPNDEYFADGLTEELIDKLSQMSQFQVIARTSIMNYKKKELSVSQIGQELKVGSVVEGSVRKFENKIRVTAQLINCNSEVHLWSSRYDRQLGDIFEVQSEIAEEVVTAVKEKLWGMSLVFSKKNSNLAQIES
jgi:adenylate cyclase